MTVLRSDMAQALRRLAKAHSEAQKYRSVVTEYSMDRFGVDPADVDNDWFIDAVDGGCGLASGMSVEEFDESMRDAMSR